jgi:membrane-bound lytic murein transglycosylase B
MQFNLTDGPPSTWRRYGVDGNGDGAKDVYNPGDAIRSAANYLRTLPRNAGGDLRQAIFRLRRLARVRQRRPRPRPQLRRRSHRGARQLRERHRRRVVSSG